MTADYVEPLAWQAEAACLDVDPEAFFPERTAPSQLVRRVCRNCPVRQTCLDYANAYEQGAPWRDRAGVWGGQTRMQRWRADPIAQARHRAAQTERTAAQQQQSANARAAAAAQRTTSSPTDLRGTA